MNVINFRDANCAHCYKCLRNCDVKAIRNQERTGTDRAGYVYFSADTVRRSARSRRKPLTVI